MNGISFTGVQEKSSLDNGLKIIRKYQVNNPCYKSNRQIDVKGLMLHSVGCAQPDAMVFVDGWNRSDYNRACVHGWVDGNTGVVYQCLPWNHRGWHGGGDSNNTHIGVEMCEPGCITYKSGSKFVVWDNRLEDARECVIRTYNSAVKLFAALCEEFDLDPLADGVIISHKEGYQRGVASGHDDPEHLWTQVGLSYTMNTFREAVWRTMNSGDVYDIPESSLESGKNVVESSGSSDSAATGSYSSSSDAVTAKLEPAVEIEPNPDISGIQPIFPFVEVTIGDTCISSFSDSGLDTVIDFTYHRTMSYQAASQVGNKFDITLYDDTALELEELLSLGISEGNGVNMIIKYGYNRGGEMYMTQTIDGYVAMYGLSFEGGGVTLTMSGTIMNYTSMMGGSAKTVEYSADIYNGSPSSVVRAICEEEGWEIGCIEETYSVCSDDGTPETFRRESETAGEFIQNKLCERAKSASTGAIGYQSFFGEDGKYYFISITNTSVDVEIADKDTIDGLVLPKGGV